MRFDFTHHKSLSKEEILKIENLINKEIYKNTTSSTQLMTVDEAEKKGAIAFFGEKYGEEVRVLNIGEGFSVELCGGTHVNKTGDIGFMKITSEAGISAGVRRIEAVTGLGAKELLGDLQKKIVRISEELDISEVVELKATEGFAALELLRESQEKIDKASTALNTSNDQVVDKIIQLRSENESLNQEVGELTKKEISLSKPSLSNSSNNQLVNKILQLKKENKLLSQELGKLKSKNVGLAISDIADGVIKIEGYSLIAQMLDNLDTPDLREAADQLRKRIPNSIVVLISTSGDKIPVVVACAREAESIDARDIMKHLVLQLGGSGGGRPDFAQGGLENLEDVDIALSSVPELLLSLAKQ